MASIAILSFGESGESWKDEKNWEDEKQTANSSTQVFNVRVHLALTSKKLHANFQKERGFRGIRVKPWGQWKLRSISRVQNFPNTWWDDWTLKKPSPFVSGGIWETKRLYTQKGILGRLWYTGQKLNSKLGSEEFYSTLKKKWKDMRFIFPKHHLTRASCAFMFTMILSKRATKNTCKK